MRRLAILLLSAVITYGAEAGMLLVDIPTNINNTGYPPTNQISLQGITDGLPDGTINGGGGTTSYASSN